MLLSVDGRGYDGELVTAGLGAGRARDVAQVDLEAVAAHRLSEAGRDLRGVPVVAGVDDEDVAILEDMLRMSGGISHARMQTRRAAVRNRSLCGVRCEEPRKPRSSRGCTVRP